MPLPRPDAVILDMDGTTVRHLNPRLLHILECADDVLYKSKQLGASFLKKVGIPSKIRLFRTKRKPRLIVHRTLHKLRRKPVEQIVEPCPGIIEILELLAYHKIPAGLVSNGLGKGYGHDILKTFELDSFFTATLFREDIIHSKPNPEPVIKMIDLLGVAQTPATCIWYIGDRAKDIAAAIAATKQTPQKIIPIGYGLNAAAALLRGHFPPDHLVLSYEDWFPVLDDLLGGHPASIGSSV